MEQQKEDKSKEPVKSTTEQFSVYQSDLAGDVIVMLIDAKHPARRAIMAGVQGALEGAGRNEEAVRAKAYAAEKMPDDWRRRDPAPEGSQTGAIRKPAK